VTKLEYPLTLHPKLAKTPRQPLIESFPAVHAFGCLEPRNIVTGPMQRLSSLSNSSTVRCLAPAPFRRGAACCARCSATDTAAVGHASQEAWLVCACCTVSVPAILIESSACSPNVDKLNRQTQELEHLVTHTKQTTATHSNRQNFHFCPAAFLASLQPNAASLITPRIPPA
jgi:hypothetical protein